MKTKYYLSAIFILTGLALLVAACSTSGQTRWSEDELTTLNRIVT